MMSIKAEAEQDSGSIWRRDLDEEADVETLAAQVARLLRPGDVVTLSGGLGAGKTTFARALIRLLTGDPLIEVPSPTFVLMQTYDADGYPIVHADFFRIEKSSELTELGWEEACEGALVLVEWPGRWEAVLPADRLDIAFALDPSRGPEHRAVSLSGVGSFAGRIAEAKAIDELLARCGWSKGVRQFMQGDASSRRYERLTRPDGQTAILMISPPRPDGPPLRFGKSYSAIARLAEDIRPFVAIDRGLRERGFSAPEIFAFDLSSGLAVIEDLGSKSFAGPEGLDPERAGAAVTALAVLHGEILPETLPVDENETYRIPHYDMDALSVEVELLLEWYAPHRAGVQLASGVRATFVNLWRQALQDIVDARWTWTLRDYHSPNLIWLPGREGVARVGLIDFQDCALGHEAYDVVSLLQDARVDAPDQVELKLLSHYARLRRQADDTFDMAAFAAAYAILGAQRATKICGIFTRLDVRDHKPQYLAHMSRIEKYLVKDLSHPVLENLRIWYQTHLPRIFDPAA